jgi:hypothetical protein
MQINIEIFINLLSSVYKSFFELFTCDPTLVRNAATAFCCYEFRTGVVKKFVNQTKQITAMHTLCK